MDNDDFYMDEHGIYPYIPGKTLVLAGVIMEHMVSVCPYMVDSWTYTDVYR
jgi:hypothetical protein